MNIFSVFVAFLENMNFNIIRHEVACMKIFNCNDWFIIVGCQYPYFLKVLNVTSNLFDPMVNYFDCLDCLLVAQSTLHSMYRKELKLALRTEKRKKKSQRLELSRVKSSKKGLQQ